MRSQLTHDGVGHPEAGRRTGSVRRPDRTNAEWIESLRDRPSDARDSALGDLGDFLRRALSRAFADSSSVQDADIDDFVQDALVRVLGSLDAFRGDSRFTTWATAIALRVAYSALRRRRSAHVSLDQLDESVVETPWNRTLPRNGADIEVERKDVIEALKAAVVERLTPRQRTVVLAELRGVASERTAELLGTNRNAVYKVYFDARKKLRAALTEAGHGAEQVAQLLERLQ